MHINSSYLYVCAHAYLRNACLAILYEAKSINFIRFCVCCRILGFMSYYKFAIHTHIGTPVYAFWLIIQASLI